MPERRAIQTVTTLFGALFLGVGILGFIPGITTHYGDLDFAGHDSGAELLGLFLYGLLIDKDSGANFAPFNTWDDWLHFSLGILMILLGYLLGRAVRRPV